ncbi:MAG: L,D-transpeptidase [Patulibacter sp.]
MLPSSPASSPSSVRWSSPVLFVLLLLVVGLATARPALAASGDVGGEAASAGAIEDPGGDDVGTETDADPLWPVAAPAKQRGATVARVVVAGYGRARLASTRGMVRVGTETAWSGQNQTLLVLRGAERAGVKWVQLLLGSRPNGRTAWVRRDHVVLGTTRYWIDVSTRLRRVTVYRDGQRVRRFRAVIGAPRTPTPHTLAAIYEINRQPEPTAFLGPWVLALTAHSQVLENYGGGPGRAAIHGRAGASLLDPLGSARSHGCVRVTNADVRFLAQRVPAGTPVDLRR